MTHAESRTGTRGQSRARSRAPAASRGAAHDPAAADNPKLHPQMSNMRKDPEDWVSGDDPMTGAQASYLTTLSEEAGEAPPPPELTKADASERIDALKRRLGR